MKLNAQAGTPSMSDTRGKRATVQISLIIFIYNQNGENQMFQIDREERSPLVRKWRRDERVGKRNGEQGLNGNAV